MSSLCHPVGIRLDAAKEGLQCVVTALYSRKIP
jgi:hypothetical protein